MDFKIKSKAEYTYKPQINKPEKTDKVEKKDNKNIKKVFISTVSAIAALGVCFVARKSFGKNFIKNHVDSKVNSMANAYSNITNTESKLSGITDLISTFLKGTDAEIETVFKTHDFSQYGRNGIPLKYPREKFIEDIDNVLKTLPEQKQNETLKQFNLVRGYKDIDGIPVLSKQFDGSKESVEIKKIIENFYYNNESVTSDPKVKKAFDCIIKGFPEFNMAIGKVQHGTHLYSVDIHSLTVLQKSMQNPAYQKLSEEGKEVLKLTALIHDFGKKGNVITKGHATTSCEYAKMFIDNYNLSQSIKNRVLRHIENHHWFEFFNKGLLKVQDVLNIFKTPEDVEIAKILAKSDFESVSPDFHLYMMNRYKPLTQAEFDNEFLQKTEQILFGQK